MTGLSTISEAVRALGKGEAVGSIPTGGTISLNDLRRIVPVTFRLPVGLDGAVWPVSEIIHRT